MRQAATALMILGLGLAAMWAQSAGGLGKGEAPPSLYELTAHSEQVVSARIIDGQVKLAQVEVVEVFKGNTHPGDHLQIAFRDFNLDLGKQDRIQFNNGDTEILFLVPEVNLEGKVKGPNRFTLYRGRLGRLILPREGDEIYLDALRVFASLSAEKDFKKLYSRLRELLENPNPILEDTGLSETLRLDLMDRTLLPKVLGYLQDPAPARRTQALLLLKHYLGSLKEADRSQDLLDEVLPQVQVLARNDPEESVRVAAVEALGSWKGSEVLPMLQAISDLDPAQLVRYKAKVILLRRAQAATENPSSPHSDARDPRSGPP